MLTALTLNTIFGFMLVFTRISAAIMIMPGFGEGYIAPRTKLLLTLAITVVTYAVIHAALPSIPSSIIELFMLIAMEVVIGVFIGSVARIIISTMHVAGMIIGYQSGLTAAMLFDPNSNSQGSVIGNFLSILTITLVFVTDMHHLFLKGIIDSYMTFPIGNTLQVGDMSATIAHTVSDAFLVAVKVAAPHIIVGLCLYLGVGIMARLMPNMHVFFVMVPLQILVSFFILMITLSAGMIWFMEYYEESMSVFVIQ